MTYKEMMLTVGLVTFGTIFTRFIIFMIFPPTKQPPHFISYLGLVLPSAAISLLVVYALKDLVIIEQPYALPEFISILFIVLIHKWKRNTLLSIASGTILYMLFIQFIF